MLITTEKDWSRVRGIVFDEKNMRFFPLSLLLSLMNSYFSAI
jgi:hypothetical protein